MTKTFAIQYIQVEAAVFGNKRDAAAIVSVAKSF
jgi:hypothetical protein